MTPWRPLWRAGGWLAGAFLLVALLASGAPCAVAQDPLVIKIRPFRKNLDHPEREYKYQLLQMILDRTVAEDGPYRIALIEPTTQGRVIEMVNQGDVSLIMTMTTREREDTLRPIRIPIYKGLYGYRALIIKRADKDRFAAIRSLDALKGLWAGQGQSWPDYEILKANGFQVIGAPLYDALFQMLARGRFDYFPRGLHEPWVEVAEHPDLDLIVDEHLIIHYPAPGYIFVAKDNAALAERLERGFKAAIGDGSFDALFSAHPDMVQVLENANLAERLIFRISNPLLSPETPLDREELWYSP